MGAIRDMCPMRHQNNGNCLPAGGFCTAVSDSICEALHSAYDLGGFDFLRHAKFDAEVTSAETAPTLKNLASRITSEIKMLRVDAKETWDEREAERYEGRLDALEWVLGQLTGENTPRPWAHYPNPKED